MHPDSALFECRCGNPKIHKLTFDGGSSGDYILELCDDCYVFQNKEFLIDEEDIQEPESIAGVSSQDEEK